MSARISPTAHYTGATWQRAGLSTPALRTWQGQVLHHALSPFMTASQVLGGPTLEGMLLARHRLIDQHLEQAIDSGRVSQVVEIAAGLSPRAWRFQQRYGASLRYIEADLPAMAALKAKKLAHRGEQHEIRTLDAFATHGANSLAALWADLDRTQGVAVITEGLINYFSTTAVLDLWQRLGQGLAGFSHGCYFSDLHLQGQGPWHHAFAWGLERFVRGRIHWHFASTTEARLALETAGFSRSLVAPCRDWPMGQADRTDQCLVVAQSN